LTKNSRESNIIESFVFDDDKILGMPLFTCDCGKQILIVPDVTAMNMAINAHLALHKQLTGKVITEQKLTEMILETLLK
jgi:hypothetical protein